MEISVPSLVALLSKGMTPERFLTEVARLVSNRNGNTINSRVSIPVFGGRLKAC